MDRLRQANVIVQTGLTLLRTGSPAAPYNNANLNVGLVSTLAPTLINEARFVFIALSPLPRTQHSPGYIHPDRQRQTGADFCCPQGGLQKRYQYIDNLTWSHGNPYHWKFGFNISYYPWNSLFPQFHFGQYTANATGTTTDPFVPTSLTIAFGPGEVTSKDNIYGFYLQDTWKITRKLTMNAGFARTLRPAHSRAENPWPERYLLWATV